MPTPVAELTDELIEKAITRSVIEVFGTMTNQAVDFIGRTPTPPFHSRPQGIEGQHVVASVGFLGDLDGIINTHIDDALALDIAGHMLGMTPAEVVEGGMLVDASGELANMIVGVFKNALCDVGFACKLTLPTIIRGADFHVDHTLKKGRRYIFNFRCRNRGVVTDIILQHD